MPPHASPFEGLEAAIEPLLDAHRSWTRATCLTRNSANRAYAEKCEARAQELEASFRFMLAILGSGSSMNCIECRDEAEFGGLCALHTVEGELDDFETDAEKLAFAKGKELMHEKLLAMFGQRLNCSPAEVPAAIDTLLGRLEKTST